MMEKVKPLTKLTPFSFVLVNIFTQYRRISLQYAILLLNIHTMGVTRLQIAGGQLEEVVIRLLTGAVGVGAITIVVVIVLVAGPFCGFIGSQAV